MASNALIQTRIDPEIRDRAAQVFEESGLTVSDAVRILLTRTANEGAIPAGLLTPDEEYDAWFRAKVQEALDDPRPPVPDEEVRAHFARRREELRRMIADQKEMIIRWTQTAQRDRDDAIDYLMGESPASALLVDQRIDDSLLILYQHPYAGRIGRARGTREFIIPDTPYIAAYRVVDQEILILRMLHMARRWPATFN